MAEVVMEGVTKVFAGDVIAVDDVSLRVEDREFMVLVGPSGCGKSTILPIIAGLEEVTAGEVFIGGTQVTDLPPKRRDVAMVFQNYALYQHMTVEENIGFGLRLRGLPKEQRQRRVRDVARVLPLEPLLQRKPLALSGGQRQRVAMGRAMVREPKAFLMDEPLSNLDAKLRVQMRAELARLHERLETTTVYVTHDQVEAITLGDRVAVLNDGRLQQVDTPQRLFDAPRNLFVAAFIGSPSMNLVEATVGTSTISFAGLSLPLTGDQDPAAFAGRTLIVGLRPSDFEDASLRPPAGLPVIEVVPEVVEILGTETHVIFGIDAPAVLTEQTIAAATESGDEMVPALHGGRATFTARVDARSNARPGAPIRLSVDPTRMHFFDPATGQAIR